MKNVSLQASAIEVINKEFLDLTHGTIDEPKVKKVNSPDEFEAFVQQVTSLRVQKPTNQNHTSSRSHLIIFLTSKENPKGRIVFADLAGFENPKDKENMNETKFINSSLMQLNQVLLSISRKQVPNYNANPLTLFLKPYLSSNSRTLMLYHVSKESLKKGLEYIKDIVASHKDTKRKAGQISQQKESKNLRREPHSMRI